MFVLVGFIFLTYKYQISQETRQSLTIGWTRLAISQKNSIKLVKKQDNH
jgi:hypothetical protein